MKYEFKPFYLPDYLIDLEEGWLPTYRSTQERTCPPREVFVTPLGGKARSDSQVASVDCESGEVHLHSLNGKFDPNRGETCLDLILYREVKAKAERTVHGVAYLSANGTVTAIRNAEDHLVHLELMGNLTPVPCTITLREQN